MSLGQVAAHRGRGLLSRGMAAAQQRFTDRHLLQSTRARYLAVIAAVAVASAAMQRIKGHLDLLDLLLLYLLLCFVIAIATGPGPAALAAVLAFLAFNFLFVPPVHTFRVAQGDDLLVLLAFLAIAVVTGQLVAGVRSRTEISHREQRRTELLYELNASLIGDVTLDEIFTTIVERVVMVYGAAGSRILLPDADHQLRVSARFPATMSGQIDRQSQAVARWALSEGHVAGRGTSVQRVVEPRGVQPGASFTGRREQDVLYLPIRTAERTIGVLEVKGRPGGGRFVAEDEQLLTSFANQAALALERTRLTNAAAGAAALAESDAFKSVLLASLSHDLRSPLAAIKASSTALLDTTVAWNDQARSEFLHAIDEETDRLTSMVGNLLDLTRIEGSTLQPVREWYDVAELVTDVIDRPGLHGSGHHIDTRIEPDLPLAHFDYVKIAQVLANLIENARKYTQGGATITVAARACHGHIEISVADTGPGIFAEDLPHVFEKFYRSRQEPRVPGSGIGLAICKGFVEAHGGRIWVESKPGRGATFRFTIPLTVPGAGYDGE